VVTQQKLLLCHEDVQTKFFRTIASGKVEEVTALTCDPEVSTYCVVVSVLRSTVKSVISGHPGGQKLVAD
jgi:hypothetical protein